jgi:hypothetical protein
MIMPLSVQWSRILHVHYVICRQEPTRARLSGFTAPQVTSNCWLAMTVLAIRVILWTFPQKPYQRIHKSSNVPLTYRQMLLDAADLCCNLRGIGWSCSRLTYFPTESRSSFTFFRSSATLSSPLFSISYCPTSPTASPNFRYELSLGRFHLRPVPFAYPHTTVPND